MDLFNKIGKKITVVSKGAVQQAKNYTEVSRMNSLIAEKKKRIETLFSEIGRDYYDRHIDDRESTDKARVDEIKALYEQIGKIEEQSKEIKESIFCPNCGAMLPAGTQICTGCGYNFAAANKVCPSCGALVREDSQFCGSCGAELPQESAHVSSEEDGSFAPAEADKIRKCPSCGNIIDEFGLFCSSCGAKLEQEPPTAEGADLPPVTEIICPTCGTSCDQDSLFCIECGTRLKKEM